MPNILYKGSIIMLASLYFFDETFLMIVTITFSALIVIELLNVYSQVSLLEQ